ncbi:MAG: 23S rRNA (adenine(2503)-C(2))-methyltransferase RlmN [Candidatus Cloacimonetes bacterium]|nr:23S rRNA (adenine(2503)-C(2))-methyltransferase RlmN [Candidatus Cloacimonadota bacterium]
MIKNILDLLPKELIQQLLNIGEKKYRANQILNWIYNKYTTDFSEMTSLSETLRTELQNILEITIPTIITKSSSSDGTTKYLLSLHDRNNIEMVIIPNGKKNTLCISSQVGCARKCAFCATAKLGLKRNLETYEITSQVFLAIKELGEEKLTNIVFMGMGEPLDNFDNVVKAIRILQHDLCFNFSPRRITVSTSGVIPQISKLAETGLKLKLAVSLNSAIQSKREVLMPISKIFPLSELKKTLIDFRKKTPYRITFEYVMIKDFNIGKEDVKALLKYLGDISCKLNVIKWNKVDDLHYETPSTWEIKRFIDSMNVLSSAVTYRKSRGADIDAACGQLAAKNIIRKEE